MSMLLFMAFGIFPMCVVSVSQCILFFTGLLTAVSNLAATYEMNHTCMFLLSWDAPDSLLGVPILYRVSISGGNGETRTVENATKLCYSSPGYMYNFTVTVRAVNTAGVGPPTSITVTVNPSTIPFTCKCHRCV